MDNESESKSGFNNPATIEVTGKIMAISILVLFIVITFILLLHLYAKWYWWHVDQAPTHPLPSNRRRFIFVPGQEPLRTTGIDAITLQSLPIVVYKSQDFKDGLECAVCLSDLAEGEKARVLPKCNHGFHVECIDMWFQSHATCPICRNTVGGLEIQNHDSGGSVQNSSFSTQNENSESGFSLESSNFPTNVLIWGNHNQISTGVSPVEENTNTNASASASANANGSSSVELATQGFSVIDIPPSLVVSENSSSSSTTTRFVEETKSPVTTRMRSLKRFLSMDRRVIPNSSSSSAAASSGEA